MAIILNATSRSAILRWRPHSMAPLTLFVQQTWSNRVAWLSLLVHWCSTLDWERLPAAGRRCSACQDWQIKWRACLCSEASCRLMWPPIKRIYPRFHNAWLCMELKLFHSSVLTKMRVLMVFLSPPNYTVTDTSLSPRIGCIVRVSLPKWWYRWHQ